MLMPVLPSTQSLVNRIDNQVNLGMVVSRSCLPLQPRHRRDRPAKRLQYAAAGLVLSEALGGPGGGGSGSRDGLQPFLFQLNRHL